MRFFVGLVLIAACGDDASGPRDAGDPRQCGPVLCGEGTICCNASCGICIAPGGSCSGERCMDAGGPDVDAAGIDAAGLDAAGLDAAGLDAAGSDAGGMPCTTASECGTGAYCHRPSGMCTSAGVCEATPTMCTEDCPGVCGCDGVTYCNECTAGVAGASVAAGGACDPADCNAPDATTEGICRTPLGWIWSGGECIELTGCSCRGRGCAMLYPDERTCSLTYARMCRFMARRCGIRGECAATEYCEDPRCTSLVPTCTAEPRTCGLENRPEIGCDGRTYRNACWAHRAGVDVR